MLDVAVVAAGGAVGSLARWLLSGSLPGASATVVANVSGCLLLGVLSGWVLVHHPMWRRFAGIGVLGGFTTFSTHLLDAHDLWSTGPVGAVTYVAGTLAGCLLAAAVGLRLGHRVARRREGRR